MTTVAPLALTHASSSPDPPLFDACWNQAADRYRKFLLQNICTLEGSELDRAHRNRDMLGFHDDIVQTPLLNSEVSRLVVCSFNVSRTLCQYIKMCHVNSMKIV